MYWLFIRDRDDEEADAEDGFTAFQGYRRFRRFLRPKRAALRIVSGGTRTEVSKKTEPPWLVALAILLAVIFVALAMR